MNKMEEKIRAIIIDQLFVDPSEVTPESNFKEDLGADSLEVIELVMQFEEEFDIQIPDEDVEKIVTVQDAYDYIARRTKQ